MSMKIAHIVPCFFDFNLKYIDIFVKFSQNLLFLSKIFSKYLKISLINDIFKIDKYLF